MSMRRCIAVVSALAAGCASGSGVTKLKFGQDTNYPPYAYKFDNGTLTGFGYDFAMAMNAECPEIEIEVVETLWANCWGNAIIGPLLNDSTLDACMTYTHTQGVRNDYMEFSDAILDVNKAAGLLTLLTNGVPHVPGNSNLEGLTIVDVTGWAPTADTIAYVENKCLNGPYSTNITIVHGDGNDASMKMLRDGLADAMFVYADQAANSQCSGASPSINCSFWDGFGTEYAYVQTGQYGYVFNGTTIAMSKKGSGVAAAIDTCVAKVIMSESYYNICEKYPTLKGSCYQNSFFPDTGSDYVAPYNKETDKHNYTDCSSGYCPCPVTYLKFGQDINYSPYAYKVNGTLTGFGYDFAMAMNARCPRIEIEVVETLWENCWGNAIIGPLVDDGTLDACMTYTHTKGVRNDYMEFSDAILDVNKAAGLLTLLTDGVPHVPGDSNLQGLTIVDVTGWAPTADTIAYVENKCLDGLYSTNITIVHGDGNDASIKMLRDGEADAMFVYADQAANSQCTAAIPYNGNCSLWDGFGTEYAYVQTGQYGYVYNGTTIAMAKKGSGVAAIIDECVADVIMSEDYYNICAKYPTLKGSCYKNSFFPETSDYVASYNKETDLHNYTDCSSGYCPCPVPKTYLKFGQDTNYPPYAYKFDNGTLTGFGYDFAMAMNAECPEIEIEVVETLWENCWGNAIIGPLLNDSTLDACMTYTHTKGVRNDYMEFSDAILDVNKAAGLLTLLTDGVPHVPGDSNLEGLTIVDVTGWAPTADTIAYVENKCLDGLYSTNINIVHGAGNDASMKMLRDGLADAMFVYADQAANSQCSGPSPSDNCSFWDGFGTEYAYVQTGQYGYVFNGTTIAMAKKGSGVAAAIDTCVAKVIMTERYYNICDKYPTLKGSCYQNSFFPDTGSDYVAPYNKETDMHSYTDCSSGYCPCPSNITKLKFGQDTNYPPYAYKDVNGSLAGIGYDIAMEMNAQCPEIEIEIVETAWENCWGNAIIGPLLNDSTLDACMTYTHTKGVRNEYMEFSDAILDVNKAAGLLTLLTNGVPNVPGDSNLDGLTIVDVTGWAPTADTIAYVENKCLNGPYSTNINIAHGDGNDASIQMLRNGEADAMFVYADQAANSQCTAATPYDGNCSLWDGFGTEYAYVQTGQYGYVYNGTTIAMAKKGSGVAAMIDSCLAKVIMSEAYYHICQKYPTLKGSCYQNSFFPDSGDDYVAPYNKETDMHDYTDCSSGYCPCPSSTTEDGDAAGAARAVVGAFLSSSLLMAIFLKGGLE